MKTFTPLLLCSCWERLFPIRPGRALFGQALGLLLAVLLAASSAAAAPVQSWAAGMEPAPLFGYLTGARWAPAAALQVSSTHTDPTCAGNDGTITTNAYGGEMPYSYLWSNGATTANLTGLAAGYYSVVVTDATGATARCFATLVEYSPVAAFFVQVVGVQCSGDATGSVTIQKVGGGTGPYTFLWSNGATTQNLTGVPAGTYTLTITDANGCTGTAAATVPAAVTLVATATRTDVGCGGQATGSIALAVSGGAAPYAYRWSNGATTQNLSGLAAGTYTVAVTDANGCTSTAGATILEPAALRLSVTSPRPSCSGGSTGNVGAAVSGGSAPYAYLWSNGATTQNLSGVAAGTYSVTVTDARGCTATGAATVTESTQLTALASKTDATCYDAHNGTVTLATSGGTAPFTYLWSNGATTQNLTGLAPGTYTVTVTDANGCTASGGATVGRPTRVLASAVPTGARCAGGTGSVALTASGGTAPLAYLWSNGATTQNLSGVSAGTYSVTVTDANGCTATATATVNEPTQLRATATATAASCAGGATGSVALAVSGGTAPSTYQWSNGAMTQNLSGVAPGTYSVTVTDARGCTANCSATVGGTTAMQASTTTTAATCNGARTGSVDLTVSGGAAPLAYLWSNGAITQDLTSVPAGTYTVTITDASGCTATASGTVAQPAALALRTALTNPSCCYASTGGIDLTVSGGTAPYTYQWSNGALTQDLSGVPAGTYSVTVTDARGCAAGTSATITQPSALQASTRSTNATCGRADGTATASASGGTAPYAYSWSPGGQTTATATGLGAGTYTVTVTDARGCTATSSASVQAAGCNVQHCTLTQGGYGNSNGVICKEPTKRRLELIADMFTASNLVLGAPGRSLTYSAGSSAVRQATAQCIVDKLPAGGTAAAFPSNLGDASGCAGSFPAGFLRNGRFANVLVGQTLTLALNLRLDNTLAGVPLSGTMTSYAALNCAAPDPSDQTGISRSVPAAVLGNLSFAGGTPTVGSLLALANKALGGVAYANGGGSPSLSDINAAVSGMNELFDNCRLFGGAAAARSTASLVPAKARPAAALSAAPVESSILVALPNPFAASTTLSFALPETARYSLTVYDLKGSEVARVSSGEAQGGVRYSFAVGTGLQEGVYIARLVTATGTQTIRLNLLH